MTTLSPVTCRGVTEPFHLAISLDMNKIFLNISKKRMTPCDPRYSAGRCTDVDATDIDAGKAAEQFDVIDHNYFAMHTKSFRILTVKFRIP